MQGGELSSFHDGRFPILSIAIAFQSGHAKCFYIFANNFSEKSREISAPAISQGAQLSATSCDSDKNDSCQHFANIQQSFSSEGLFFRMDHY